MLERKCETSCEGICPVCMRQCSHSPRKPWQRVLYEPQDYPDNYVDPTFLGDLVTQAYRLRQHPTPPILELSLQTTVITNQLSVSTIFLVVFYHTFNDAISALTLLAVEILLLGGGLATIFVLSDPLFRRLVKRPFFSSFLKRLVLFVGFLLGLSPVLKTLTSAFSSDTIWALTILLVTLHLFCHDYEYHSVTMSATSPPLPSVQRSVEPRTDPQQQPAFKTHPASMQSVISLNAAVFASVLLASRLRSTLLVFALVALAFETFAGFPMVARAIKGASRRIRIWAAVALCLITLKMLLDVNTLLSIVYVFMLVFIAFVCPFWLKFVQQYKSHIQGPWDYDSKNEGLG